MLLTSQLIPQFKSLSLTSPFLGGSTATNHLFKPTTSGVSAPPSSVGPLVIKAKKTLQGRVICATSDKTVSVLVKYRYVDSKYKVVMRKKTKYQAHDPLNQFKVGDAVQLERCRPISKRKSYWAVPIPIRERGVPKPKKDPSPPPEDLGIPLESES